MMCLRKMLTAACIVLACCLGAFGCGDNDTAPGEHRFCCDQSTSCECSDDDEDVDQAQDKLSVAAQRVYTITDDNAPLTADACNAGGSTWGDGYCKCGTDYTDSSPRCNEPGATTIMVFAAPGCIVSSATLSFQESVGAWANPGTITVAVHRILRPMTHPALGQAGVCVNNATAGWFRSGPEQWSLPGAKGDGTDRSVDSAPRVNAAGSVLSSVIAEHDTVTTERHDVAEIVNGCPAAGECVLARYLSQGVHATVLTGTVSLVYECASPPAVCGDGTVEAAETCDDGASVSGDGCSASCALEPGWSCAGAPSMCATTCGDGIVAGAEQCDDGNTLSSDGCSAGCLTETCTCQ